MVLIIAGGWSPLDGEAGVGLSPNRVGLIEVFGPIYNAQGWVDEIDDYRENSKIKAIVIRFDSPGGAVAASQELYEAMKRARLEKPVIASMGNVAASGAYYAALGADSIVANPGTTTGSIGVIMELMMMDELLSKLGLESEVVKSGEFKDAGSPTRPITMEERRYFQSYIDDAYAEFVDVVEQERGLDSLKVVEIADGRVFTGTQALEHGLVDILGDQYLATHLAAQMAGIEGEPSIVRPYRKTKLDLVDILLGQVVSGVENTIHGQGFFQYMWKAEFTR
ncbi:putative signal peptide peptidase SppA [bacterium BMS3Bbin04]|nr:putative signal peptide peptidase SppA [bacterium BMS3Bbin04]